MWGCGRVSRFLNARSSCLWMMGEATKVIGQTPGVGWDEQLGPKPGLGQGCPALSLLAALSVPS